MIVFICVYGGIVAFVLFLIKINIQDNYAGILLDNLFETPIFRLARNYVQKRSGYEASPQMNEEADEDIDRGDSVAIGYTDSEGRNLFWERNSAAGI